jgi:hypothetical protein
MRSFQVQLLEEAGQAGGLAIENAPMSATTVKLSGPSTR